METHVLTERVQVELRRTVRVSALNREVLGRINAAIPLHSRNLGRIGRRSSEEFGRCTDVDSAISAVFAHQPRHFERRILDERIVRIRQRAIVLGRRRVGNDRLGRRLSRRQVVGGDFPAQRILLHARHDHSERRRLELAVDDIERQHAVLLHPRIVHELRVSLTAAHKAELFRERHTGIARGGIALVRFHSANFLAGTDGVVQVGVRHVARNASSTFNWRNTALKDSFQPRSSLERVTTCITADRRRNKANAHDIHIGRIVPHVSTIERLLEPRDLHLDVLPRRNQLALHEVLKGRKKPELGRKELLPNERGSRRTLAHIEDIALRFSSDGLRASRLPKHRGIFRDDKLERVSHVRLPVNRVSEKRLPGFPFLPRRCLGFVEVIRQFVVSILILFRPVRTNILVDGRHCKRGHGCPFV